MGRERTFDECERIAETYQAMLLDLEPDVLEGAACERLLDLMTRVKRTEAVAEARLTRRATTANRWLTHGDRTPGHWLARRNGITPGRARRDLELAEALAAAPATEQALADGRVSAEQAAEIAAAAKVDATAEARLLAAAPTESLRELQRRARNVRAAATDDTARRERIRQRRHLRHWTDADGAFCFTGRGLPEDGAAFLAALKPHHDAAFAAARQAGHHDPADAYAYDALMAITANRPTASDGDAGHPTRAPAKIILTADLTAMTRGHTTPGETCEIAGIGPVTVAAARDLLGDAFLALVLTDGIDIRNVTHLGRAPTTHQRTALEARGRACAVPGCARTDRLEIDHVDGWALTRRTHIDQLDWLCGGVRGHHHQKTHHGYTLHGPPGRRTWHPPDQPPRARGSGPDGDHAHPDDPARPSATPITTGSSWT